MWNLTESSMSSPHHVVDERVVFAIGTSPTFMQNARGQFQNGRPSYLHVITPLNYLVEIVKIGEKRILRILGCRNELGEREGKDRVVIGRDIWRTIKGNWFPMFHLTTLKCTFNLECCVAVTSIVLYLLLLCCSFNERWFF